MLGESYADLIRVFKTDRWSGIRNMLSGSITKADIPMLQSFVGELKKGTSIGEAWNITMLGASKAARARFANVKDATEAEKLLNTTMTQTTTSTVAATAATIAFNVALSFGISLAIQGIITLLDNLIHAEEKQIEELNSLKSEIKENDDKIASMNESLNLPEIGLMSLIVRKS